MNEIGVELGSQHGQVLRLATRVKWVVKHYRLLHKEMLNAHQIQKVVT
jgi:hypothetical protein